MLIQGHCTRLNNILFNDTLNTFYLWYIASDYSDSERKPTEAISLATVFD